MSWSWSSTLIIASAIPFLVSLSLTTPLMPLWTWERRKCCRVSHCFENHVITCTIFFEQVYLLHVNQQRLLIVLPLNGEFTNMRKLITGQLHCHLEAVGVQVTEVVHTCRKGRHRKRVNIEWNSLAIYRFKGKKNWIWSLNREKYDICQWLTWLNIDVFFKLGNYSKIKIWYVLEPSLI